MNFTRHPTHSPSLPRCLTLSRSLSHSPVLEAEKVMMSLHYVSSRPHPIHQDQALHHTSTLGIDIGRTSPFPQTPEPVTGSECKKINGGRLLMRAGVAGHSTTAALLALPDSFWCQLRSGPGHGTTTSFPCVLSYRRILSATISHHQPLYWTSAERSSSLCLGSKSRFLSYIGLKSGLKTSRLVGQTQNEYVCVWAHVRPCV